MHIVLLYFKKIFNVTNNVHLTTSDLLINNGGECLHHNTAISPEEYVNSPQIYQDKSYQVVLGQWFLMK